MDNLDVIQQAIDAGDLLKIDFKHGGHGITDGVIRPIRIDAKGNLVAYNYSSDSLRLLCLKRVSLLRFDAVRVDGNMPSSVPHFRCMLKNEIVTLFKRGWLISTEEEYLGIYPRCHDDTAETNKGYEDQYARLQYLKAARHPFHLWFEDGGYWRFDSFYDAMNRILIYADVNRASLYKVNRDNLYTPRRVRNPHPANYRVPPYSLMDDSLDKKPMETIYYYSRNAKKPPFKVSINIDGKIVYINCDCDLGVEKKVCRHIINAIRGDKTKSHSSTTDETIGRLRRLFGKDSTLRQHLEEKWRLLREFAGTNPDNELATQNKRKILGEAFANGFLNEHHSKYAEPFDADEWESNRQIYADGLSCPVTLKYSNHEGVATTRGVIVEEIFISNETFYLLGYCLLRNQRRTFRVDRIECLDFGQKCLQSDKSMLLDVVFQGRPLQSANP